MTLQLKKQKQKSTSYVSSKMLQTKVYILQ